MTTPPACGLSIPFSGIEQADPYRNGTAMLIFENDALPRNLAKRLRSGLVKSGQPCTHNKSLEMAAHLLERRSWNALQKGLGPSMTIPDDDEIGAEAAARRRISQIASLVRDGVPPVLAENLIDSIRPTGARMGLPMEDLEEDVAATAKVAEPKWRDPERDRRPTLADLFGATGGKPLKIVSVADEDPAEKERFMADMRAARTPEQINAVMEDFLRSNGHEVGHRPDGTPYMKVPEDVRRAAAKSSERFGMKMLAAGAASRWEVCPVRAARIGSKGTWEAAPGPAAGEIIVEHGSETTATCFRLMELGHIDHTNMFEVEAVVTSQGMAVVEKEGRRPKFLLRRLHADPDLQPRKENPAEGSGAASDTAVKDEPIDLADPATARKLEKEIVALKRLSRWEEGLRASLYGWRFGSEATRKVFETHLDECIRNVPPEHTHNLAAQLMFSKKIPTDPDEARKLLTGLVAHLDALPQAEAEACAKALTEAHVLLGHLLMRSANNAESAVECLGHFLEAAKRGHGPSAFNGAMLFRSLRPEGHELKPNDRVVLLQFYRLGVKAGNKECMMGLADMVIRRELSVEKGVLTALLKGAADLGDETAAGMLPDVDRLEAEVAAAR